MVPRRRAFLALLGSGVTGLAGCAALSEGESDPEQTDEPTATPTESPTTTPIDPAPVSLAGPWPTFQADAARTGSVTDVDGPAMHPTVDWRTDTWGLVSSPVVDEDAIYAVSGLRDYSVHAFDAATGEQRWQASADGRYQDVLATAEDAVYVGTDRLYAFDAETGEERWNDPRSVREGIALADGRVVAPADDTQHVRAFDATTGDDLWSYGAPGRNISATAAPAVHDGTVYVVSHEDLATIDLETGDGGWRRTVADSAWSAPTVTDDRVYVATESGLEARETAGGDEDWRLDGRFRDASPAVDDGTLYVGGRISEDGALTPALLALDAATGEEQWRLEREGFAPGRPVVAGDTVYATSEDNRLYAVATVDGDVRWSLEFEWGLGTPAVFGDALAVSAGGRLYRVGRRADPGAADPWAGVVETTGQPDVSNLDYPGSDFYFGTNGYDVTASAEASGDSDAPVEFSVDVTGDRIDDDEQVSIEMALTNTGDDPVTIQGGAPLPFGVVTFSEQARGDRRLTAWAESYEESQHVHWSAARGYGSVNSILLSETLDPGETRSETYVLSTSTHRIQPGEYSYTESYTVRRGENPRPSDDDGDVWHPGAYVEVTLEQPASETGAATHDLAVTDVSEVPEAFAGRLSVDVLEPATEAHPGLVEITLENPDGLDAIASPGSLPFVSYVGLAEDGSRLLLLEEEMFAPAFVTRGDGGDWIPTFEPHLERVRGRGSRRFESDARFSKRYLVVGDPDADDPLSAGDYVFDQGYADSDGTEFTWRFQLSLRDAAD